MAGSQPRATVVLVVTRRSSRTRISGTRKIRWPPAPTDAAIVRHLAAIIHK